jgi:hypothetical protein
VREKENFSCEFYTGESLSLVCQDQTLQLYIYDLFIYTASSPDMIQSCQDVHRRSCARGQYDNSIRAFKRTKKHAVDIETRTQNVREVEAQR